MQEKFDVAVIGGAFSGAATALLLRREAPELSVVVIERSAHFDRKVGEATTEVSGCFLDQTPRAHTSPLPSSCRQEWVAVLVFSWTRR